MSFLKLCDNDPLVSTLTEVFRANIIRVPEERMQPLRVIAARKGKLAYRGRLADLISGADAQALDAIQLESSLMADVSGKRSRKVDAKLGLDILDGFLRGFGLPVAAGIREQFTGATLVSFSFSKVARRYVDAARVGKLLAGRSLDVANPVVAGFVQDDPWDCLLIDSVITSQDFSIAVERSGSSGFEINVPAIQQVLSKAETKVRVASTSSHSLTFHGDIPLAFAFSCQRLILDTEGHIVQMPSDTRIHTFGRGDASSQVLLTDQPAMLDWDE